MCGEDAAAALAWLSAAERATVPAAAMPAGAGSGG
jgi:hypothetical protein